MERADHCAGGGVRHTRDPLARTGMRRRRTVMGLAGIHPLSVDDNGAILVKLKAWKHSRRVLSPSWCPLIRSA